ncbi:hypothetical protein [Ralstonia phage RSP15]|uniref:hypothetical protein n=1 Tax=Ralstonia phage RSP15 TaxID=1785960 RepID=UPI00074D4B58|nr:hypothetical protein BH754_gp102 [Ralstonia phage RSP15]BAU40060.1 hypothetical protein [Ralstonia phage RSP15]
MEQVTYKVEYTINADDIPMNEDLKNQINAMMEEMSRKFFATCLDKPNTTIIKCPKPSKPMEFLRTDIT